MTLFLNALVTGLSQGTIYALIAIAYTIVYNATKVFNLAQGTLVAFGVIMAYFCTVRWGFSQPLTFVVVVAAVVACSLAEEQLAVRPFLLRKDNNLGWFVGTLAFDAVLAALLSKWYGPQEPAPIPGPFGPDGWTIGSVRITAQQLLVAALLIVVLVVAELLYQRTWLGHAMRATSEDRDAAVVLGVSPRAIGRLAFFWGGLASGLIAYCIAPIELANVGLGLTLSLKGFVALAIGGFGSIRGAVIGGLLLGCSEAFFDLYGDPRYEPAVGLVLLLVVLCVRPGGLLRRRVRVI